jgi:hypothetical protein
MHVVSQLCKSLLVVYYIGLIIQILRMLLLALHFLFSPFFFFHKLLLRAVSETNFHVRSHTGIRKLRTPYVTVVYVSKEDVYCE